MVRSCHEPGMGRPSEWRLPRMPWRRSTTMVPRTVHAQFAQPLPSAVQARHNRTDWDSHDLGDLPVREALDSGHIDGGPGLVRHRLQSLL